MADTDDAGPDSEPQPEPSEKPGEKVFWGEKWNESGFEKNAIHFDKTAKVMADIFQTTQGFCKELGSRYSFLDIGCAPGGFSRFMCSDPRCERGFGISLPVTEGGFRLLFTWTTPDERKFQVKFRDMMTLEPENCCDHPVDIILSDAQYLPLRKADQPGPDPALAKLQSQNPALGIWCLLFQQLRLGLTNLRNGGVMMFRLNCKDGNVDWYFEAVCQIIAFVDSLFESMTLFKSGKSHQSDGTAYMLCRGFCKCEFEAMGAEELLRKSIMVAKYEHDVVGLSAAPIFRRMVPSREVQARTRECFSMVDDAIRRYKEQTDFSYAPMVKQWRCVRPLPNLRRTARLTLGKNMPLIASRMAVHHLENAAKDVSKMNESLQGKTDLQDLEALRIELANRCQETVEALRASAEEVQRIIAKVEEDRTKGDEDFDYEDDDWRADREAWAAAREPPEPEPSVNLHVTGLMEGIEEATLQRCFARVGKVEEIRFLPQEQTSRCSALVRMSTVDEATVAREKLDNIIPEGSGFQKAGQLTITFQVKDGIPVCDHLYVRGIPSAVHQHQVSALFSRHGPVLWCRILHPKGEESWVQDRCALVQMGSSDDAQAAIQALNWESSSLLMPAMKVRYAGPKVFATIKETEEGFEEDEQGSEEEDEDGETYGVVEEIKPAAKPLKERPAELGKRWKESEDDNWKKGPEGARLWGWAMQPVKEEEQFPALVPGKETEDAEDEGNVDEHEPEKREPENSLPSRPARAQSLPKPLQPLPATATMEELRARLRELELENQRLREDISGKASAQDDSADKPVESWEDIADEEPSGPSEFLCMKDAPPGLPESVMQMWFKPYGHVLELRPLEEESSPGQQAFLVQLSCVEEAINSVKALHGKSIMKGKPLILEYWHPKTTPIAEPEQTGIDSQRLLEACRAALAKRKAVPPAEARQADPSSEARAGYPSSETRPSDSPEAADGADSWEELADSDGGPEAWEESDSLCMTNAPPGLPEMVMQFWFKPFGQVKHMRPLTLEESGRSVPAFLVQMSSVEEASAAVASLNGKPIMKGQPLSLEYWHGKKNR